MKSKEVEEIKLQFSRENYKRRVFEAHCIDAVTKYFKIHTQKDFVLLEINGKKIIGDKFISHNKELYTVNYNGGSVKWTS